MNVVFWLLVFIAACGVWWLLSPAFSGFGDAAKSIAKAIKENLSKNEKENEK